MALQFAADNDGSVPGAAYVHGEMVELADDLRRSAPHLSRFYATATPYYMTKDIQRLLLAALPTFPRDAITAPAPPPTPSGFMWLEWKLRIPQGVTRALGWETVGEGIRLIPFGFYKDVRDGVGTVLASGDRLIADGEADDELLFLVSAWEFMSQRLAAQTDVRSVSPSRAVRRRLSIPLPEPPLVRVIQLRARDASNEAYGHGDREYHQRWIVRGHWRQQWYPSLNSNRPKWIAPYVKGPANAPLKVPPVNVFAVAR
jgi:hypothetical protein